MTVHELPDFHPETGHLHTCNGVGPCGCAAALYCVAADEHQQVSAVLQWVADTGCTCPGDVHYASLPDHELDCPAQVEHLLLALSLAAQDGGQADG